ncbi:MAG TPA: NHL repeat-containing protein [Bryobacteraceae bacterium]|nr:NHL repeat-containing protein [Bryobacteraceae bacterium]
MSRLAPCALLLFGALAQAQNIFTIAGYPLTHRDSVDSQPALSAPLESVYGLLIDKPTGRLLFNDEALVLRLEPDGSLLTIAGFGPLPFQQPQIAGLAAPPVVPASFIQPFVLRGMAEDSTGALYLADAGAGRVYRVGLDGLVTIFAGGGTSPPGFQSDGGPATAALIPSPRGLVFDSKGNLDFTEVFCNCIRQVTPTGIISTLYTAPPSPVQGRLPNIEGLAIDSQDNLYYTEWFGNVVMKVATNGTATPVAGTGTAGFSGDGGPAVAAQLNAPSGVALDAAGNIYIADTMNHRIRKVTPDGIINTLAGTAVPGSPACTAQSPSTVSTQLCLPAEVILGSSGDLIIADYGNRLVRQLTPNGAIATVAGNGKGDPNYFDVAGGAGGPEIHATFSLLGGAAFDRAGNLYVSDTFANHIRKISTSGVVSTIAGNGQSGYSGDGGPALQASLVRPGPISVGPDGAVYVITGDSRVRKITPDGIIHLVAGIGVGSGLVRDQGDGGPAIDATLNEPGGVAFDQSGNIYIADTSNARVRKIDSSGIITTIGPTGQQGVDYYNAVAVDPQGNVYVAWTHAPPPLVEATVNRINPDGTFTRVAGTGLPCNTQTNQFADDGAPALQTHLCAVTSMTMGPNGVLYLSEGFYSLVFALPGDGTIHRAAGNTAAPNPGDGGPAVQASLHGTVGFSPLAVTFDPSGNLYIPIPGNNWIRMVTSTPYTPVLSPAFVGAGGSLNQSVAVSANFAEPFPFALQVSANDGGSWLTTNRVTGLTGESFEVNVNTKGLGPGFYHGIISVTVYVPVGGGTVEVDLPVTLTI